MKEKISKIKAQLATANEQNEKLKKELKQTQDVLNQKQEIIKKQYNMLLKKSKQDLQSSTTLSSTNLRSKQEVKV